ncbi:MAG: helix-turn-helix transcriptional regulator [Lentisphaeraceae bacterium]|nr:helix-turn-helix transcriptional regulator [Lentisphaeraceae bacterium]
MNNALSPQTHASLTCQLISNNTPELQLLYSDCFILLVVLEGSGRRFIANEMDIYKKGDCLLIPPHTLFVHVSDKVFSSQATKLIKLTIPRNHFEKYIRNLPEMKNINGLFQRAQCGLSFDAVPTELLAVLAESAKMSGLNLYLTGLSIYDSFALLPSKALSPESLNRAISPDDFKTIQFLCCEVNNHYRTDISAENIAVKMNISPQAFSRLFKRLMKKTFQNYLTEIRLTSACHILKNSELIVEDVGKSCGFRTLIAFSKRFKDCIGVSPAAYRKS